MLLQDINIHSHSYSPLAFRAPCSWTSPSAASSPTGPAPMMMYSSLLGWWPFLPSPPAPIFLMLMRVYLKYT